MHPIRNSALAAGAALLFAAGTALAASDYLLELDGVKGKEAKPAIEVQSFSWGVSNPTSAGSGGMSAGKVSVQDISLTRVAAPRDVSTGQASGKRMHKPMPVVGESRSMTVEMAESPDLAASEMVRACASGKHFPKATLTGRGQVVALEDVVISSCAVEAGLRKIEFTGHVTLIK